MSVQSLTWAIEQNISDPAAKLLLIIIANRTDHVTGLCWPSVGTLVKETGLSEQSVRRKTKLLQDTGLLIVEPNLDKTGRQSSNHYRLPLKGVSAGRGEGATVAPSAPVVVGATVAVATTAGTPYEPRKEGRKEEEKQKESKLVGESIQNGKGGVGGGEKSDVLASLLSVLDRAHAEAIVAHRQKKRSPLTPLAARLLVKQFAKCPDPNAAAEEMLLRGWQSFKAEWAPDISRRKQSCPIAR